MIFFKVFHRFKKTKTLYEHISEEQKENIK